MRIEENAMKIAYQICRQKGLRITALLEEGIFLANEKYSKDGPGTEEARYLISQSTRDEQFQVKLYLGYLRMPLDNPVEELDRRTFQEKLVLISQRPSHKSGLKTFRALKPPPREIEIKI